MGAVHNDLHSWAAKARGQGRSTIEIDIETADRAAEKIVELSNRIMDLEHDLRTQAPDSWRPEADELLCRWLGQSCDDDGVPELQAATRAFIKTLRPQTAESGK